MTKNKQKRTVEQVSSKSLIPPTEPDEVTEADVYFSKEEKSLAVQMKELKARVAALGKKKKQAVSGKKLPKMRKYAEETTEWAVKAGSKLRVSVQRANAAVASLDEYEEKLGIVGGKCIAGGLAGNLEVPTEAAEVLEGAAKKS